MRELGDRDDLRLHQLGERLAGADRGELVRVAHQHDVHVRPDGAQQRDEQLEVRHRRLVDDQQIGLDLVAGRPLARDPAQGGVDRRRVHPGRFGHPPGGATGRGDQRDRRVLRTGGRADQPDRRRLAGARAAGDDREAGAERRFDRGPLLGRGNQVIRRRSRSIQGRLQPREPPQRLRQFGLQSGGRRPVGPDHAVVDLQHELVGVAHVVQQLGTWPRPAQQLGRTRRQIGDRQAGRAVALGLAQRVDHGRPNAAHGIARDARGPRDRVGDREPDAEDARQLVRPRADYIARTIPVLLRDPRHQPRQPVGREQQVQRAGGAQPVPRADRLVDALRVQPGLAERGARVVVDRLEHAVPVALEQSSRPAAADVLDALEIRDQRELARRCDGLGEADLDLHAEALVVVPGAGDADPLALLQVRERPDQHHVVALTVGVDDREARVLTRPAQAPDHDLVVELGSWLAVDHPRRPYRAVRLNRPARRVSLRIRNEAVTSCAP